jgi:hypothetical protein
VLKIKMASELDTDIVLLMDSDVELIRPIDDAIFRKDGRTVLYRRPNGVHGGMSGHVRWHQEAAALLGIRPLPLPLPDYISSFMGWDRQVVHAMQARISQVAGRPWVDVLAARLHLSEWTLYGVFADRVYNGGGTLPWIESSRCNEHWGTKPLTEPEAVEFAEGLRPTDVAIMISAKSRTAMDVRRRAREVTARRVGLVDRG